MIVATAALGQTDGSVAAIQHLRALEPPPQIYSSHTHSHEARWVKCLAQGHSDHEAVGRAEIKLLIHRTKADPLYHLSHGRHKYFMMWYCKLKRR